MNSSSKDDSVQNNEYKYSHPQGRSNIPGRAIFNCGEGSFGPVNFDFRSPTAARTQSVNAPIASVTIDTSCLSRPKLMIDFSGILTSSVFLGGIIQDDALFRILETFDFTLYKTCKGSKVRHPVKNFSFSQSNTNSSTDPAAGPTNFNDSRTLNFKYFSCEEQCEGCCTYTLELNSITDNALAFFSLSINGSLCAHAIESSCGTDLMCGEGCFGPSILRFTGNQNTLTINKPIAAVTIDTSNLHCPGLLIDFAGILTTSTNEGTLNASFNFILFESCKNSQAFLPVKAFTTNQVTFVNGTLISPHSDSHTLELEYFSCEDQCENCCTYTLMLASISEAIGTAFNLSINGTLCVMTVESCHKA